LAGVPATTGWKDRTARPPPRRPCPIEARALFASPETAERAVTAEGMPAFDEAQAVPAGILSYGNPLARRLARLERAVQPEVIFGGHDHRVQERDTTQYPYCCICNLRISCKGGVSALGTGWVIGKRTVATAGHCVYTYPEAGTDVQRGWALRVEVIPGRDGANWPFGSFVAKSANLYSVSGWTEDHNEQADYGAIILDQDLPLGVAFGYGVLTDQELTGLTANIVGYPGEYQDPPWAGTMWGDSGRLGTRSPGRLNYTIDTTPGESGSAVFYLRPDPDNDAIAVGIHNYGVEGDSNYATRITAAVRDNLRYWRQKGGDV
jgi:V8-like Glu-specific endopeptidase